MSKVRNRAWSKRVKAWKKRWPDKSWRIIKDIMGIKKSWRR